MYEKGALTKCELLYFGGIILYYLTFFADLTFLTDILDLNSPAFKLIRLVAYILFFLAIVDAVVTEKALMIFVLLAPLIVLCALFGKDNSVVYMLLILFAGLCTHSRRVVALIMWLQIICMIVVIGLSTTGVLEDAIFVSEERIRHGLGFFWTTTPALMAFFIAATFIFLKAEKITWIDLLMIEIVQVIFYLLTDSRMCFAVASLMVVFTFLIRYGKILFRKMFYVWSKLAVCFPLACCLVSIAAQALYDEESLGWMKFDQFLHKRLSLGHSALNEYGIRFFGQYIKWVGNSQKSENLVYNYVDNSYLQILLSKGIIYLTIIIAVYTWILYKAAKDKKIYTSLIVSMILLLSITEPRLWDWAFNPIPFLIIDVFGGKINRDRVALT